MCTNIKRKENINLYLKSLRHLGNLTFIRPGKQVGEMIDSQNICEKIPKIY
jgi:hypothetical protein